MLAINRQSDVIRMLATGSLAFAVGLTGVAAYMSSSLEHQNLTFGKEQSAQKDDQGNVAGASTTSDTSETSNGGNAMSPQMSDTSLTFAPAPSSHVQGSTPASSVPSVSGENVSLPAPLPTVPPVVPSEPQTTPPSGDGGAILDLDPVINTVDELTDSLGL